jgi:hypothetical protein
VAENKEVTSGNYRTLPCCCGVQHSHIATRASNVKNSHEHSLAKLCGKKTTKTKVI